MGLVRQAIDSMATERLVKRYRSSKGDTRIGINIMDRGWLEVVE